MVSVVIKLFVKEISMMVLPTYTLICVQSLNLAICFGKEFSAIVFEKFFF